MLRLVILRCIFGFLAATTSGLALAEECPRLLNTPAVRAAATESLKAHAVEIVQNSNSSLLSLLDSNRADSEIEKHLLHNIPSFALSTILRDVLDAVRRENYPPRRDDHNLVLRDAVYGLTLDQAVICFPKLGEFKAGIEKIVLEKRAERLAKERSVEAGKAQEKERERVQAIEDAKPKNVLRRAYRRYAYIRRCHESRIGYSIVFITEDELERARISVKAIEEVMKKLSMMLDPEETWSEATSDIREFRLGRGDCQEALRNLEQTFRDAAPDASRMNKDF